MAARGRGCRGGEGGRCRRLVPAPSLPPTMGNFMGVVTRETRRLRPWPPLPDPARPRHLLRGQKSPGEVGGAAAGSDAPTPAFTSSLHPYLSSRCLAKDERELRSGCPTVPGRAPRRGPGGAGGPRPAHSLACGLCTPHQPREGRSVGSQLGNRAPSQRGTCQAAVPPLGRETGAHGPSGVWAAAQLARPGAGAGSGGLPGRSSLPSPGWAAEVHVLTLWGGFEFSPH